MVGFTGVIADLILHLSCPGRLSIKFDILCGWLTGLPSLWPSILIGWVFSKGLGSLWLDYRYDAGFANTDSLAWSECRSVVANQAKPTNAIPIILASSLLLLAELKSIGSDFACWYDVSDLCLLATCVCVYVQIYLSFTHCPRVYACLYFYPASIFYICICDWILLWI